MTGVKALRPTPQQKKRPSAVFFVVVSGFAGNSQFNFFFFRQDIQQLRLENEVLEQRLSTFALDDSATFSDEIGHLMGANNESSVDNDEDFPSDDI